MSDAPPPPKKPGSLRDRIAAFEKPSTAGKSAPAPPPLRPKPAGGVSWKPKPPSPPADNATFAGGAETEGGAVRSGGAGGMSASDAKESIGRGGSLKDRMAALQGRGAFGAPAVPAAPIVGTGKKWVPPPKPVEEEEVVVIPERGRADDGEDKADETPKTEGEGEEKEKPEGEGEAAADPEEEERQRRAAIAARMARLGGARVGMSPPIFGPKPVMKKRPSEDSQSVKSPPSEGTPASPPIPAASPETSGSRCLLLSPPWNLVVQMFFDFLLLGGCGRSRYSASYLSLQTTALVMPFILPRGPTYAALFYIFSLSFFSCRFFQR
ncbi:hypothetical protein C8F04DRAFT_1119416 [Mycena alexandri]|uniref:Uncharacterized protein n=1 Tax=Mycena alexandri TaxID=1745969 RepID=A0AAD6SKC9_9AGAR|nr:hypothetical protein C8F04DRAFT_1119416 [Mycena alexandri]